MPTKVTRGTFVDTERNWNETTLPLIYSISLSEFILSTFFSLIFRTRNSKYYMHIRMHNVHGIWARYDLWIWSTNNVGLNARTNWISPIYYIWFELNLTDDSFFQILKQSKLFWISKFLWTKTVGKLALFLLLL